MTPQVSCIDVCIMPTDVWYVLSHYLSIVHHCRIYLGHFPCKYPKTCVSSPGFSPKMGLNDRKDVTYRCDINVNGCGRLPNSLSVKIPPFPNLFRTFPLNMPIIQYLYPRFLVLRGMLRTSKIPCIYVCIMPTDVGYVLNHYLSMVHHCRIYFLAFSRKIPSN